MTYILLSLGHRITLWKKYDNSEIDSEISDNEFDNAGNEPIYNEFLEALQGLRPEVFEKFIEGAKKLNVWKKGQKLAYTADNNQLLQNKQELLFDENTELLSNELSPNEYKELSPNEYEELLPNRYKELLPNEYKKLSSNEDDEFSSYKNNELLSDEDNHLSFDMNNNKIIDMNICNRSYNELPLRMVSQFLHLVKDYGYTKMLAIIHTWANHWLSKSEISMSLCGCHVKTKSLLFHEDFKSNIRQYLHANKFKITPKQFVKFVEYEAIPAL
ncbi:25715_t:CDS:2, partial [Gigaspora margarita]